MPSETSAVNAAYIEARMKQFKLVRYARIISGTYTCSFRTVYDVRRFPDHAVTSGGNRKETLTG